MTLPSLRIPAALLTLGVSSFLVTAPAARAEDPPRVRNVHLGAGNPRTAKEQALERLTAARDAIDDGVDGVGDEATALHELDDAIEELEESLDPEFWLRDGEGNIDGDRLDPDRGAHAFHEERESAQEIFDAIDEGEIDDTDLRDELLSIVDLLVSADRSLAQIAIDDALAAGGDDDEIDEAQAQLLRGDDLVAKAAGQEDLDRRAARLYEAMDNAYRHAWSEAIDSLE